MKNSPLPGRPIRPRVDMPKNSHIHRGLTPFFRSRDLVRDNRLKEMFRMNLAGHRLSMRPDLSPDCSYRAANSDPCDIRIKHGRRLSRALDVFTFFGLFLLFGLVGEASAATEGKTTISSPITIQGTVWSAPVNNFPTTNAAVYDNDGMVFLGSTSTAAGTGQYQLTVLPVGLDEKVNRNSEMVVLGNPVMNEANLELTVLNQDNYKISVFDVSGKQLYSQAVSLAEGDNKITITGLGAPGIKIVQVTDGQKTYTAQVLQVASSDFGPTIRENPTSGHTGLLKSSNYTTTLRLDFTPQAGYVPNFKLIPAASANVNDTVMQESQTINKTLNVFDVNGLAVAPGQSNIAGYYNLKVKFKDGQIITFPATNGIITINRVEYGTFSDSLTFIPDTIANPKFLEWMIGRKIHQQRYEPNVFQNIKTRSNPNPYVPPGNVQVAIANMPDKMQMYLIPKKMLDPRNMTDSITLTQTKLPGSSTPLTFEMMTRDPIYMTKFVDVTTARPLYFVIDTWDVTSGAPIPIADQDRVQIEL